VQQTVPLDDQAAAERLLGLLDYVDALIKLDERVAMRLSQHKLQDGSQFVLHEHELTKLPGVSLNKGDDEGPIWLRVQRLQRTAPPIPDEKIVEWIEVSQDPDVASSIQSAIHRRITREEKEALIEQGKLRLEDCSPSLKAETPNGEVTFFDVFFRLEDQPEIQQACNDYVSEAWATWAEREMPRRRSIQAYQKLFEIAQRLSQSGASESVELVWGIGLTRWSKGPIVIELPILELSVEIEISDDRGSDILVRPRNTPARIDLRAFDKLAEDRVALAEQSSLRALRIIERDEPEGVSPFRPETFSSILKICGSQLDPEGKYLPEGQRASRSEPLPELAEGHIGVSDRWVIYARRRSVNATLRDIQMLKAEVRPEQGEPAKLEGAACTLIMGASDATDSDYEPLGPTLGALDRVSAEIDGQKIDPDHGDLFFPKPFNDDQVQIIRRLEKSEGLVVQGPPGTGKTHTIANIISHMLATGKRVLVVSHGETALKVLRDHLPDGIRDLAISVTSSEREGTKQVEKAVQLMLEIVNSIDANLPKQVASIRDLAAGIRGDRDALEKIDKRLADLALVHFEPVPGTSETSYQLATRLAADRSKYSWFTDRPTKAFIESGHAKETVDLISKTRALIGPDIIHRASQLPRLEELPSPSELVSWHLDLTEAESLGSFQSKYDGVIRRLMSGLGVPKSTDLATNFKGLAQSLELFSAHAWTSELVRRQVSGDTRMRRVNPTVFELFRDMRAFLKAYQSFVARPVQISNDLTDTHQTAQLLSSLAEGKKPFGWLSFSAKQFREKFEAVRIAGKVPTTTEDWTYVRQYVRLRSELPRLRVRWHAVRDQLGIPPSVDFAEESVPQLEALLSLLEIALSEVPARIARLQVVLADVLKSRDDAAAIIADKSSIVDFSEALSRKTRAARVSETKQKIEILVTKLNENLQLCCDASVFIRGALGSRLVSADNVEHTWSSFLATLNRLERIGPAFETLARGLKILEMAGAPEWAAKLGSEPRLSGDDPCVPSNWQEAWEWASSMAFLTDKGSVRQIDNLNRQRSEIEKALRERFASLVKERTFYNLARSMKNSHKTALAMFANIVRRIGAGTGNRAVLFRRDAREAMEKCYDAVPCWIMPAWRASEQLPSKLGSFDLVILDEASQSDARDLPAVLRGKKLLVVGDDKQVSPTAAFISLTNIRRLRNNFLSEIPYRAQIEPGGSLYDLARVMFPGHFVMLKEHFRCVEPIIRFSTEFYTQPLIPLRVPTANERLDPPLIDIFVRDGWRRGRSKINPREAEVIVDEIDAIISNPTLATIAETSRPRSIGVISLIGGFQAAYIQKLLLDRVGEAAIVRHRIICGDSATLQGNERDIVFLSMVADKKSRHSQTAEQYAQRFNVALSRARDRMILVRSVELENLNPKDLKAKVIQHFRDPMPTAANRSSKLVELCESGFERAVFTKLTEAGYKVTPQVGSQGFFIDMVVEGDGGRRLAIECDGDRYHGPERWADDMRRQRILERVGWTFWRCFGSDYMIDADSVFSDLVATLEARGIKPIGHTDEPYRFTLHRTVGSDIDIEVGNEEDAGLTDERGETTEVLQSFAPASPLEVGDRIILKFLDRENAKPEFFEVVEGQSDEANGLLGLTSALAIALSRAEPEDEISVQLDGETRRLMFVALESAEREAA